MFSVAFACESFAAAAGVVEVVPALTLLFKATTWASLALAAASVVFTSFEAFFAGATTLTSAVFSVAALASFLTTLAVFSVALFSFLTTSVVLAAEPSFLATGVLVSEVVFNEVVEDLFSVVWLVFDDEVFVVDWSFFEVVSFVTF